MTNGLSEIHAFIYLYNSYCWSSCSVTLWQALGRQKKKTEKSFWILCPSVWRQVGPQTCPPLNHHSQPSTHTQHSLTASLIHSLRRCCEPGSLWSLEVQLWTNQGPWPRGAYILGDGGDQLHTVRERESKAGRWDRTREGRVLRCSLQQWSLIFWHQGPDSWKKIFPWIGVGDGLGMIQTYYISCAFYFYFYYISSISDPQALDPGGWGPLP